MESQDPLLESRRASFRAGLKPSEFWELTPFETWEYVNEQTELFNLKLKMESQLASRQAWEIAYLTRVKKMPQLRKHMENMGMEKKRQTPEEQLAIIKSITAFHSRGK